MNETANASPATPPSASTSLLDRVRSLAEEVVAREGCKLYDIEFVAGSKGRGRTLRIYIDRDESGVTVDDCSNVSRGLNLLLDVEDPMPGGAYTLEVSSPGLERPLRQLWHYQKVIGQRVNMKLQQSLDEIHPEGPAKFKNCKTLTGTLVKADEGGLEIDWDGTPVTVPLSVIHKAHLIFVPPTNPKPGHNKKKS